MKSRSIRITITIAALAGIMFFQGCYSFSGINTTAKSIQVDPFFNNTDLGPANLGPDFTNRLKDFYQRNSSIGVVQEGGDLQIEGVITDYKLAPIAPVSSGTANQPDQAAFTRLTITMKANFVDNTKPENSFKDKSFSFYADFPNSQDFISQQGQLQQKIFDQIMLDIFNATVATW